MQTSTDAVVVGGGLAGLACAGLLARRGAKVVLLERAQQLGGRGQSAARGGFTFNLGPHALYHHGPGMDVLRELGVTPKGSEPRRRSHLLHAGQLHRLPTGLGSLLTTSLLSARGRFEAMRVLTAAQRADVEALASTTVEDWVRSQVKDPVVAALLNAVLRLSAYTHAPDLLSAGAALRNFQIAGRGVMYLDGGWQALVEAVLGAAESFGARVRTGAAARKVHAEGSGWRVELDGGESLRARAVVLALPPLAAAALCSSDELRRLAAEATPVHVASMDLGLSRLPVPEVRFVLGVDRPLYFSVQSDVAPTLAPEGKWMVQLARYLHPNERAEPAALEREMEALLDLAQPGWRDAVVERRFMPNLLVTPALVPAAGGGYAARAKVASPERPGLFLAGDWVGPAGMLANASLHSAALAAEEALSIVHPDGVAVGSSGGAARRKLNGAPMRHDPEVATGAGGGAVRRSA